MTAITIASITILEGTAAFFFFFSLASLKEKKARAAASSFAAALVLAAAWPAARALFPGHPLIQAAPAAIVLVAALLFFAPLGGAKRLAAPAAAERVDERDVAFAREEYRPGTEKYAAYYAMRPENKAADDSLRSLPELLAPGGKFYDPGESPRIDALFRTIEKLGTAVDGPVAPGVRGLEDAAANTAYVKEFLLRLGAADVGVASLNPAFVYSHVGRGPEEWGAPIENTHPFAVVFALEMDYFSVEEAPRLAITAETSLRYLQGALISIALADHIRSLGRPARAHIAGSNYQIMLPPAAHDAGLGELGRCGYLISPRLGARVRLGAVTTSLPLAPDGPVAFGVQDFCEKCRKCAENCPSGAIPKGERRLVRGVRKWPLAVEKCLRYWRVIGTDCGLCMKVCPFSHPPTFFHDMVRLGIRRSAFARTLSLWGDDLFYGRLADRGDR